MFTIEKEDGSLLCETETKWDDVPDRIKGVLLINNFKAIGLTNYDVYWFSNEAVAGGGTNGNLTAQIIGGANESGEGREIRQDLFGYHIERDVDLQEIRNTYAPHVFKKGVSNG